MEAPTLDSLKNKGYKRQGKHAKYKYVCVYANHYGDSWYRGNIPKSVIGKNWSVILRDAKSVATAIDKQLIRCGLPPVNVLKKVG